MEKFDLEALQLFLNNNKDKIPKPTKGVKTLFDVMKQPHLENVWSNIYAFFFNPEEDHGFGNLFLRTLVELIKEKQYGRDFTEMIDEYIDVKTEDSTDDSKRLDVALQSDNYAILIENKVYADLYNNLGTYWRNYPQYDENHKQGVALSLYLKTISKEGKGEKLGHDPENWVNITHLELMERITINGISSPDKYRVLFQEFKQNIINETRKMDIDRLNFYVDNVNQIEQISRLRNDLKKDVISKIKSSQRFKNKGFAKSYELGHCTGIYFHKNSENQRVNQKLVIGVICKKIFTSDQNIVIVVEALSTEFIKLCKCALPNIFTPEELKYISINNLDTNKDWAHIAICKRDIEPSNFQDIASWVESLVFDLPIAKDTQLTLGSIYERLKNHLLKRDK